MRAVALCLSALLVAASASAQSTVAAQAAYKAKISAPLATALQAGGEADFLVVLSSLADLSDAAKQTTKAARVTLVVDRLRAMAARTQPAVIDNLRALGAKYTPYWVANVIAVRGSAGVVDAMAQRADVARLASNVRLHVPPVEASSAAAPRLPSAAAAVQWNVTRINAPAAWTEGYYGQGVVIGGQDTGYDWSHPTIKNQYRGWNGTSADHNHNWHDAFREVQEPYDDQGHGTHTMGTIVGNDLAPGAAGWPASATNAIGVAPGARWIGCRNMKNGVGTVASYTECYQFFMAPTDLNDENADPALAADIINNSWSCPPSEGCTDANVLRAVVENVRAAGILTVHSAGNSGPSCSTVADPAAIYAASFSVGATDSTDTIASFSSRGPVTIDGSNRAKPEISAPGVNVYSAVPGASYRTMNGTSMAGPHVAGAAALVLSARPGMAGNVDALEVALEGSAVPRTTSQGCGGDSPTAVPNNVYGWGRVDALAAVHRALAAMPVFTDDPLAARSTLIKAIHVNELRQRIGELRARYGLSQVSWTDPALASGASVKAVHLAQLRAALGEVYTAAHRTPPAYTTPIIVAGQTPVSAAHIAELRAAILAIW